MASTEARPADFVDHTAQTPAIEKELSLDEKRDGVVAVGSVAAEEELDLYVPFKLHEGIEPEANPLTTRAVIVGIVLGCLVNASNLYLGKSLFGAALWRGDHMARKPLLMEDGV